MEFKHKTVLLNELVDLLDINYEDNVIDATLGGGGHAEKALAISNSGNFIGIDIDQKAIECFENKLKLKGFEKIDNYFEKNTNKVYLINKNFSEIEEIAVCYLGKDQKIDVIYADLGFSTDQLNRYFSFQKFGELDLRMDQTLSLKAKDLVNGMFEKELVYIFEKYSDEKLAKPIAKEIVFERKKKPIETKEELVEIIRKVVQKLKIDKNNRNYSPEARIFQALRIAVNNELKNLEKFLERGFEILSHNGRLGVISFHSGEDKIVKKFMKSKVKSGEAVWIKEMLKPDDEEIRTNPKSSSAKLRVIKKI